jgi:type III restriction enzyme
MQRLQQWREDINRIQKKIKYDFVYVEEAEFEKYKPISFRQLVDSFRKYTE